MHRDRQLLLTFILLGTVNVRLVLQERRLALSSVQLLLLLVAKKARHDVSWGKSGNGAQFTHRMVNRAIRNFTDL